MRRRRLLLLILFALGLILVLFFSMGPLGGPSDEAERETVAPPPDLPRPLAGTFDESPAVPSVSGRVVDTRGEGLVGAQVSIVVLDDGKRIEVAVRTDPDGRFTERTLRRGKVSFVEVLKKGYPVLRHRPKDAEVRPGRTVTVDLAIPKTFFLAGFVKSMTKGVVEGARVSYDTYVSGPTDDLGRFRIEGIDSRILLRDELPSLRTRAEGYPVHDMKLKLDGSHANFDDIAVDLP